MARTVAGLPEGTRITDYISLGVIAKTFSVASIQRVLRETGRMSKRQRDLPMHVVVYYTIAMALYMKVSCREVLRCLMEGIRWLTGPMTRIKVAGKSGISQARVRLGCAPVKQLHDEVVVPIAVNKGTESTKGAWYREWRLVSLDGSTLDVADTKENEKAFGRPAASRGKSAYPQIRFEILSRVVDGNFAHPPLLSLTPPSTLRSQTLVPASPEAGSSIPPGVSRSSLPPEPT